MCASLLHSLLPTPCTPSRKHGAWAKGSLDIAKEKSSVYHLLAGDKRPYSHWFLRSWGFFFLWKLIYLQRVFSSIHPKGQWLSANLFCWLMVNGYLVVLGTCKPIRACFWVVGCTFSKIPLTSAYFWFYSILQSQIWRSWPLFGVLLLACFIFWGVITMKSSPLTSPIYLSTLSPIFNSCQMMSIFVKVRGVMKTYLKLAHKVKRWHLFSVTLEKCFSKYGPGAPQESQNTFQVTVRSKLFSW